MFLESKVKSIRLYRIKEFRLYDKLVLCKMLKVFLVNLMTHFIRLNWENKSYQCIRYARIQFFTDPRFSPYTGEYGSVETRVLEYFLQCIIYEHV